MYFHLWFQICNYGLGVIFGILLMNYGQFSKRVDGSYEMLCDFRWKYYFLCAYIVIMTSNVVGNFL